jgi:hypothetical protein
MAHVEPIFRMAPRVARRGVLGFVGPHVRVPYARLVALNRASGNPTQARHCAKFLGGTPIAQMGAKRRVRRVRCTIDCTRELHVVALEKIFASAHEAA